MNAPEPEFSGETVLEVALVHKEATQQVLEVDQALGACL